MTDDLGKIVPLTPNTQWSTKAAIASAMEHITSDETPVHIVWIDAEGFSNYRSANMTKRDMAFIAAKILKLAAEDDDG